MNVGDRVSVVILGTEVKGSIIYDDHSRLYPLLIEVDEGDMATGCSWTYMKIMFPSLVDMIKPGRLYLWQSRDSLSLDTRYRAVPTTFLEGIDI